MKKAFLILLIDFWFSTAIKAQTTVLSDSAIDSTLSSLITKLKDNYPFPEIASKYAEVLNFNLSKGAYYHLTEPDLAKKVTSDINREHRDLHLALYVKSQASRDKAQKQIGIEPYSDQWLRLATYGFSEVTLDALSSTAYINIPGPMFPKKETFDLAANAMNLCAYSNYVIIDMRTNPGGSGAVARFIASYFFEPGNEAYYLYGFYKDKSKNVQEWTFPYVPGNHNPSAKLFILTSRNTGSAAEGFAFAMQKLSRAKIIGDTTAGAGIAENDVNVYNNIYVHLPFKMIVAPNSNIGWEGIGVIPDVLSGSEDAYITARKIILREIISSDTIPDQREIAQWLLDSLTKIPTPVISGRAYRDLPGNYGDGFQLAGKNGNFILINHLKEKVNPPARLLELMPDVFVIKESQQANYVFEKRLYLHRDFNGIVDSIALKTLLKNGSFRTLDIAKNARQN